MQQIQTIGIDLAKNVFQVHGVDEGDIRSGLLLQIYIGNAAQRYLSRIGYDELCRAISYGMSNENTDFVLNICSLRSRNPKPPAYHILRSPLILSQWRYHTRKE